MLAKLTSDSVYAKFWVGFATLAASVITALLMARLGYGVGVFVIFFLVFIPFAYLFVRKPFFGLHILTFYSFFLFYIGRLLPFSAPMGVGFEIIIALVFLGVLFNSQANKSKIRGFNNPIVFVFAAWTAYGLLEVANPSAVSITAWLFYFRFLFFNVLLYFVLVKLLDSRMAISSFTKVWLFFAVLASLYAIYQQIFGYTDFEWKLINEVPRLRELIQNGSVIRKFSFFSDVATFGVFMAFSCIFSIVYALDHAVGKVKVIFAVLSILFMLGVAFSGTRTAIAMIPIGLVFYGVIRINKTRTLIFGIVAVLAILTFIFGPFYGTTAIRIRSTFMPSEDASMVLRDINRARIQPYIYSHPIGGGVFTTGGAGEEKSPGHPLAGFPPDSGYLQTALELGWIGLFVEMLLYYVILLVGVKNYFSLSQSGIKVMYAAYLCSFFALCVANFFQLAMPQKPINLIVYSLFAIIPNLAKFAPEKTSLA